MTIERQGDGGYLETVSQEVQNHARGMDKMFLAEFKEAWEMSTFSLWGHVN